MQSVGIIGVGEIGRAMVEGLCLDSAEAPPVFLSPRGASTASGLAARFDSVQICADNQEVLDRSRIVVLAVRPADRHEALAGLQVPDGVVLVNVVAGVSTDEMRRLLATNAPMVRAIPLPGVRERRAPTVTCPAHPEVDALFEMLGGSLAAPDESTFAVFSTLTGALSSHYAYLTTLTGWAVEQGLDPKDAQRYVRSLFQGLGRALGDETRSLAELATAHETPGGSNERIRSTWFDPGNTAALTTALDGLLQHLRPDSPER